MALFHTNVLDPQIKALPTVGEVSGSMATFDTDMTENLIEVVCDIQYSQASGTPTPQDEKPILTFDSLTLYHNDINLWNEHYESGTFDQTTGKKTASSSLSRNVSPIKVSANTSYYFVRGSGSGRIFYYDSGMTLLSTEYLGGGQVVTTPNNCAYVNFAMQNALYTGAESFNYPSTDTQYHAFNGAYIPFGQTVAKGTLNVTTGVLTAEWLAVDLGSLSYTYYTSGTYPIFYASLSNSKIYTTSDIPDCACSCYKVVSANNRTNLASNLNNYECSFIINGTNFTIRNDDYTDTTAFATAMVGQTVVYELDTPTTIQLSATQITALLNENNIWCDTGNTSVKYILSVGKAIS